VDFGRERVCQLDEFIAQRLRFRERVIRCKVAGVGRICNAQKHLNDEFNMFANMLCGEADIMCVRTCSPCCRLPDKRN